MPGQRTGELPRVVRERDRGGPAIRDRRERIGRGRSEICERARCRGSRRREHDRIRDDARPVAEMRRVPWAGALDPPEIHAEAHVDASEPSGERVDERAHASAQRHEERAGGTAAACRETGADEAAVSLLGLAQARHEGIEAELVDRRAVDARDERTRQPVDDGAAEATAEERADGHVAGRWVRRDDDLYGRAQLRERGEEAAREERREARRDAEADAIGHRHETVVVPHEGAARLERRRHVVAEPELAAERQGSRTDREERVGAALDEEAVDMSGGDLPA